MYASRRLEWENVRGIRKKVCWDGSLAFDDTLPCCPQDGFVFKMPWEPPHPSHAHALAEWADRREAFAQRPNSAPDLMVHWEKGTLQGGLLCSVGTPGGSLGGEEEGDPEPSGSGNLFCASGPTPEQSVAVPPQHSVSPPSKRWK